MLDQMNSGLSQSSLLRHYFIIFKPVSALSAPLPWAAGLSTLAALSTVAIESFPKITQRVHEQGKSR